MYSVLEVLHTDLTITVTVLEELITYILLYFDLSSASVVLYFSP